MPNITASAVATIDPATGETLNHYEMSSSTHINAILDNATAAAGLWATADISDRADALRRIAQGLKDAREEAAAMMTAEMGKTLGGARAEVDKCVWICEHYAEHGARYLADVEVDTDWTGSYVQFPPLGVVLAVMPWNYPFWQVLRAGVPALMAGNTLVLKHASNVTGSALLLDRIIREAGLADGIFGTLIVPGSAVAHLIEDPRISAVTLTGSEQAGVAVAEACATQLKKSVLELGGSDAFIVLDDADVADAAATAVRARFQNAGQSCIAAKRMIVVDAVADEFEERIAVLTTQLRVGDSRIEEVEIGPMARVDLRDELADQLERGLAAGGRLLAGGTGIDRPGAFFVPTVVGEVDANNPLFTEETFGPLAAVTRVGNANEAIQMANRSSFGLSSSLWTADIDLARRLSSQIQAGAVFVNTMSASDPRMPIGGIKRSGWGRELGAVGIREFVNTQAVTIAPRIAGS